MANTASNGDPTPHHTPVCAIGASAGGLPALRDFFSHIASDLGAAFVVIMHLAPEQPSALSEILAAATAMPVQAVAKSARLEPNCVYVIPPDRELVIQGDDIKARPFNEPRGRRHPIDVFFESVATARADGVAIVLSGSGSDGASGVRAIKEAGGVVFVQDPDEAEFAMMPNSAIAAGIADFVAPVAEIAAKLAETMRGGEALRGLDKQESEANLERILKFLRERVGHDFSNYKRATVFRRISRRMQLARQPNLAAYFQYLCEKPEHAQTLLADLLISVTTFFRDPDASAALAKKAVAPIFDGLEGDGPIRAWVAGCATGEEAYSVGMILLEEADRRGLHPSIQIFASDIDENALAVAREGRYPGTIRTDVSEERLRRFFIADGADYRVRKELRDLILFVSHSALKDPPFIKLDLITCRNFLIYLQRELQRQLLSLFHYALKPGGYLFLGSAETVEIASGLFNAVDRDARIFASLPPAQKVAPPLPQLVRSRNVAFAEELRLIGPEPPLSSRQAHAAGLEHAAPPSALVDGAGRIVHLSAQAGRFLCAPEGGFTADLAAHARPELRVDLKLALQSTLEKGQSTLTRPVVVNFDGRRRLTALQVAPARESGGQALVFFLDAGEAPASEAPLRDEDINREEVVRLREELSAAQDRLIASRKEQEAATQELFGANEELQSINEEYRSTAEELETSKEEQQSLNEELQTLNSELKSKLETISAANSDLENLISATEIATIFLDSDLKIRMFTPAVVQYFSIAEGDVGRAIADFTRKLDYPGLEQDAVQVLKSLTAIEHEIPTTEGGWLLARIRPYRTLDQRISGLVLTFAEITRLKRAEQDLAEELKALTSLHDLSTAVFDSGEIIAPLREFLDATIELLKADFGVVQFLDEKDKTLRIVAQRGFDQRYIDRFAVAAVGDCSPGALALAHDGQTEVGDVQADPIFAPILEELRAAGVRAVISTPLRCTTGRVLGVLSVHFRKPRTFADRDRRLTQICARRAADTVHAHLLREEVRAADRRKDEFLATLAHELRNPLTPIVNALEVLKHRGLAAGEAERLHAMMGRQASHLKRLVDDLLDVSRIAQGKIELRRRIVDLNAIVREAVEAATPSLDDKRDLRVSLAAKELSVDGDPVRLVQIVGNLLGNALKYTPSGGQIEVGTRRDGAFAIATLRDNGAGISPKALPHIFDLFFQGERDGDRPADGVGVGLSLAQSLAALHGGAISAASNGLGKGSAFTLRLPLTAAPARAKETPAMATAPASAPAPAPRVLIVDDNHDVADSFSLLLDGYGAQVRVAYSGAEALVSIPEFRPDIIFIDIGMPEMDGYEVAEKIRKMPEGSSIMLVALSGWDRDKDRRRGVAAGFDRHLAKPADPDALHALLTATTRTAGGASREASTV
ncbi:PAS domain-containing protein [Rhodoblastus acidophilus]|uniref:PAS domain-containing protein n=1 Tax=Candidatus Rhodoblastus alkanivorans TaxID=2954117 RepID=A0ABS9Z7Z5_9HYPH|nr:chemotaxis protein CheB [Candidatus Rhodoblastus alkanivorans]MCI4678990.1 PAS domain-containing protein [Candidatus Rhodoblastus alkanivorans]MCI4683768.1 PAS domain-containing protein [Candidatus Rhodoblastus alkanivorans]MDI4641086.1 PAS domain-containing protein [Rhodoblastus acidophilus]